MIKSIIIPSLLKHSKPNFLKISSVLSSQANNSLLLINLMKSKGQNHKINEIISLSSNYKLHRQNLQTMKPAIGSLNKKREKQVDKMISERVRYRQAARDFNDTLIHRQNTRLTERLCKIAAEDRQRKSTNLSLYGNNQESVNHSRSNKRLKSMSSSRSLTSISSNFRQRTLRDQQIRKQNAKIAARITNPKTIRSLARSELDKSYKKGQEFVQIRSRFSQKNQEIIKSLALHGLHFDRKDVQYLPQLTSKRRSQKKIQTSTII